MRRLITLSLLIYVLTFWALASFQGQLLDLVIPLVLLIGAALLYGPGKLDLEATRTISTDRATEGTQVSVTVTVTNHGGPIEMLYVGDHLPDHLSVAEGEIEAVTALASGETLTLDYVVEGRRGNYVFGDLHVAANDRLNLLQRRKTLTPAGDADFSILPQTSRLRSIHIRPRQTRVFAGTIPARVGGSGTEFYAVRAYQPGDSLRHLNWRANARHLEELFTNEYQQERIADVGIILDARQRADIEIGGESLFEHSVLAAATLSETFLHHSNRVGLLVYGRFLAWTMPGYGKRQKERILRALARAEIGDSQIFDQLRFLPTRFFPPKSQLVLVTPLLPEDPQYLINLRARGYELIVVSPDPLRFERAAMPREPVVNVAYRIARIERALLFDRLRQAGIRVVDWNVHESFEAAVSSALSRQPVYARPMGILR